MFSLEYGPMACAKKLTSFIDGFAIEFGQVERFTNIVKNSHLLEQRSFFFFQSNVKVTSFWDLLSHYALPFSGSGYCC